MNTAATVPPTHRRPVPAAGTAPRTAGRGARRGLSLVEVMISLAITSMLLTAIAAAFHSSTQVITENDQFFRATQAARVALNQILSEVRRADAIPAVADVSGTFPIPPIDSTLLPISRPYTSRYSQEFLRYYRYNAQAKRLELYFQDVNGNMTPGTAGSPPFEVPGYTVANNVQVAPFSWETAKDNLGVTYVARVSIALEVAVGKNRIRISGSAVPRRSIATYE
jgi:prepilin-type N-terminal cleavage/methylation domain-containing protein